MHHTETRENEEFLFNIDLNNYPCHKQERDKQFKTLRFGEQAYCINGDKLNDGHKPVFIGKSEYDAYNRMLDDAIRKSQRKVN